ncbi:murein hydrolase activator EnvC family protein [Larkinella insperata]|uniref:Murein hydrolase activator EnvC family protein n=1 Tax=Larkinella insperata TaxID=332158 RepID=A0ABW3Q5G3_9BACT|nr:peptidoglycan DD-metalloendopeptidase family protein [Larkinella insperata]
MKYRVVWAIGWKVFILAFGLCWLTVGRVMAQQRNRQQLEKEKKQNVEKVSQIRAILRKTSSQKQATLGQLKALNQEIAAQSKQINLLTEDVKLMNSEIQELRRSSNRLQKDLEKLKKEYGDMLYAADKRRQQVNPLGFLFSAESFNQLVARYKYLQQYSEARKGQVRQMEKVRQEMLAKQQDVERKKKQQQGTLVVQVNESKRLEGLKDEKNRVAEELSEKEQDLRTELAESRKAVNRLEAAITEMIRREIRERQERERLARLARLKAERERIAREKAAAAAAAKAASTNEPEAGKTETAEAKPAEAAPEAVERAARKPDERRNNLLNEEEAALASSFAASRNRLPWPVTRGFISDHYGVRPHPVLKGVMQDNPGIDIQTNPGEVVRAVYDGVVQYTTYVTGMYNIVAIQHGDYYTVYAKLKSVSVQVGQRVKAREVIGVVATDKDGVAEVQFQVWKSTSRMNPESWLIDR